MRKIFLIIVMVSIGLVSLFSHEIFPTQELSDQTLTTLHLTKVSESNQLNSSDIAWMLTATALVLFMTPGLGFFYGGMVRKKNMISTILQSFIAMGVMTVVWVIIGFSLAFGEDVGGYGIIGNPFTFFFFNHVDTSTTWELAPTIPFLLFALFQMKFAIIAPALVTGAFAERIKFWSYMLFMVLFCIFIYAPLAHMTWHPDGYLFKLGVLDFAGGTVVHMSAGWAALAGAIILKKRTDVAHNPSRITYVILGTSILWFGWFGFNAGSAVRASELTVIAFTNTTVASAAAAIAWGFIEKIRGQKISAMGTCIGAVVGLVAITPACGFVTTNHAIFIGLFASMVSSLVVHLREKTNIDDTLDVFPCHGVGGLVGMFLTGVFASHDVNEAVPIDMQGLAYGFQLELFTIHTISLIIISILTFAISWGLLKLVDSITPLRVSQKNEELGLDLTQHGETL